MKHFWVATWAPHYDATVIVSDEDFPFVGSERALVETVALAETKPGARVRPVDEWIETGRRCRRPSP